MDFVEGMKILRTVCQEHETGCEGCPMYEMNNKRGCPDYPCNATDMEIDFMEKTIEDWCEKHKLKTWKEVLLELLPDSTIATKNKINVCPYVLFGKKAPGGSEGEQCYADCEKCWNEPAAEVYQNF